MAYFRVPYLLKVMLSVAVPANGQVKASIIPVLASAYSILMKHKYDNLSAYHRLTSVIAIRGGLDERVSSAKQCMLFSLNSTVHKFIFMLSICYSMTIAL